MEFTNDKIRITNETSSKVAHCMYHTKYAAVMAGMGTPSHNVCIGERAARDFKVGDLSFVWIDR